jgi:transposase
VVEAVECGSSRREAAERFEVSASSAIRWADQFAKSGSVAARASGGSVSPLEEHTDFLLGLVKERPDLTLDEVVVVMRASRIGGSRSAVWRFYARHHISFKKKSVRGRAGAPRRGAGAPALEAGSGPA